MRHLWHGCLFVVGVAGKGNLKVRDIRGSAEESRRLARLFRDAPSLRGPVSW